MTPDKPAGPVPFARRRCWLCADTEGRFRADVHCSGLPLCERCWTISPRGYNTWVRAAEALAARLDLPRTWRDTGFRNAWLQDAATRHRIAAWCDVDTRNTLAPEVPFGWLDPVAVEAAAAELADREAAFTAARVGAEVRRP